MKKKNRVLLIGLFLAMGTSSRATLLAYEGFDYSAGTLSGQNGGTGWTGAWGSGDNYRVVADSLTMTNLPFAVSGGSAIGTNTVNRSLSFKIDFSKDGVYYTSFIVKRTGWSSTDNSGEWFDFHYRQHFTNAAESGISSGEGFESRVGTGSMTRAGDAATTNAYFLVSKMVTHASGNDKIYLKAYSASDTIDCSDPAGWTVVGTTADIDLLADMITLWGGSGNADDNYNYKTALDEIRIGTTWADVVPNTTPPDLIAYEGFDYPVGSLTGQGGSTNGWTGDWRSSSNYQVVADSLTMTNLPFVPTGGSIIGDDIANRDFAGIDLSADAVYYVSFIMQRIGWSATDDGGEWIDFHFRTTGYTYATSAGISSDEKFEARVSSASMARAGDAATTNPYFLVSKIVAHASGNDEIYLKAYSESNTIDLSEPAGWTVAGGVTNCDLFADMVTLWAGKGNSADGNNYQAAVDEIRIGRTWAAVVPTETVSPATIVSVQPLGEDVLEMVVDTSAAAQSVPQCSSNLVLGIWNPVAHSIDGNVPFIETNLDYSTQTNSGRVIYVKADAAAKFFRIDTEKK